MRQAILATVAAEFGLANGPKRILGVQRGAELVEARFAAIWCTRQLYGCGLAPLGRAFARDHSTIRHALYAVDRRRAIDPAYAARLDGMLTALQRAGGRESRQ